MTYRTGWERGVRRLLLAALAFLALSAFAGEAPAAEPKGTVEASAPGFWVMREDKRVDLSVGDGIYEFDILMTDETGAGTVRFIDGTALELRNSTELDVKEVVFSEERDRFNVGIVEGTARVVTGAIVRRNPRGFKVTTPKSTIGIRGTDLTAGFDAQTEVSSMSVASTETSVSFTDRVSGFSVTVGPGVSVACDTMGNMSVQDQSFNVNNREAVEAAAEALSGVAGISDPGGQSVGGDSGDAGGGADGPGSGNGGGGNGSGGGNSGGGSGGGNDCGSSNSSPGRS